LDAIVDLLGVVEVVQVAEVGLGTFAGEPYRDGVADSVQAPVTGTSIPQARGVSPMRPRHAEAHRTERIGWLRAAVLGANDGIVSTASLVLGVAAAHAGTASVLVAGTAGLVAGAMSMAAGEYVSVGSQADTEGADLRREERELASDPEAELAELAAIYVARGLDPDLAQRVAAQLMAHDALGSHARDELGISEVLRARPLQAALASAASFAAGAAAPLITVAFSPETTLVPVVSGISLVLLGGLGWLAARVGGARPWVGAARVMVWGALAMVVTAGVGALFGPAL
jgi:VIT1/CCC1 family predicted Fe2+/Mn2+ transporter